DTWSWNVVDSTSWAATTDDKVEVSSGTIQIDQETEQQDIDFAQRLFWISYDRDMTDDETEMLAQYITNGEFDKALLAKDILGSSEWSDKYGTVLNPDTAFVSEIYVTAFGHMPSNEIRDYYLDALDSGDMTRQDVMVAIAQSVPDGQVQRS